MHETPLYAVPCTITRGAFPGERVFYVHQADSSEYVSVAAVRYFRLEDGRNLEPDEPNPQERLSGYIDARLISVAASAVRVEFPNGQAVFVPNTNLYRWVEERRVRLEEASHVLVGSRSGVGNQVGASAG